MREHVLLMLHPQDNRGAPRYLQCIKNNYSSFKAFLREKKIEASRENYFF